MSVPGIPRKVTTSKVCLLLAAVVCIHGAGTAQEKVISVNTVQSPTVSAPLVVRERRMELSGCAAVEGGVLVVEDELIGAVLLLEHLRTPPLELATVKLERKKKDRAPYADAFKLFPFQDFEDIASDGASQVFLIGSHQGKDGERRPDREFLFHGAWDGKEKELKVVGEQYSLLELIAPVLDDLGCGIGLTATEVSEALNIEGLALLGEQLYVGLRSPLTPAGKAILLSMPVAAAMAGKGPVGHRELDLNGLGIRALDWDPVRGQLLVLSGPSGEGSGEAALWALNPASESVNSILEFSPDIARKVPEGICRLPESAGGKLLVVLDGEGGEVGAEFVEIDG